MTHPLSLKAARYGYQVTSLLLIEDRFDIVAMMLDKPNGLVQFSEVDRNLKIIRTHQCAFQLRHRSIVQLNKFFVLNRPQFAGGSKVSMDGAYGKK